MRFSLLASLLVLVGSTSGVNTVLKIKGTKLLAVKFLALKTPLVAPVAAKALAPAAIAHAKAHFAKKVAAIASVKHALVTVPLAVVSMKVGAVTGAHSGAKAGLMALARSPQSPGPEPGVPSPGDKTPANTPPAPIHHDPSPADNPPDPAPAGLALTPTSPAHYRRRRQAEDLEGLLNDDDLRGAFAFMSGMDENRCVNRALCEIAVDPNIAMGNGVELLNFMNSLSNDENAPWMHYKSAISTGAKVKSRNACVKRYPDCDQTTEDLVEKALSTVA